MLLLAGCRSVLGFDDPSLAADARPDSADSAPPPTTDAVAYRATAIRFETAGGDYLSTGRLANTADSPRGTYSVWLRFHAGDDHQQLISVAQVVGIGGVLRTASNKLRFVMPTCAARVVLDMQSQQPYTTQSGWIHVLASWDVSAGRAQLYVNDVADRDSSPTINDGSICYTSPKWGFGGLDSGSLDADVADVYAALGVSIDLDVEANRRLFADARGKPIDLGAHCEKPTGMVPAGCMTGDPASWFLNKGYAAGFAVNGDGLAIAPSSPSD